jgi:hypothetical protein
MQRNEVCITLCANFFYDEKIFRKHQGFSIAQTCRSWVESPQASLSYQRRCDGLIPHTRKRLQQRSIRLTTSSRIRYRRYRIHTVTGLWAEWHWIRVSTLSSQATRSALETKQSSTQLAPRALSPWEKRRGCAADHSPPFSAGYNNEWRYTSVAHVFIQLTGNTFL